MRYRRDYSKDLDLILNEITKRLQQSSSVEGYYQDAKHSILEYLDPSKSYPYLSRSMGNSSKWVVKQENDPAFVVALTAVRSEYYVLDFYFVEISSRGEVQQVFHKRNTNTQGIQGTNYLDTLCRITLDEVLPMFEQSSVPMLYFNAYNEDGNGSQRKAIFAKIISKFQIDDRYRVQEDGYEFRIYKPNTTN